MALRRSYSVSCDRCWRATGEHETSQKARASAARRGWKRIPKTGTEDHRGRDLCDRCKDGTNGEVA